MTKVSDVKLLKPTDFEAAFFGSSGGRDLRTVTDAFKECAARPEHLQQAAQLITDMAARVTDDIVGYREFDHFREEGGLLSPDSEMLRKYVGTSRLDSQNPGRRFFSTFETYANHRGLYSHARVIPIDWHEEHITDRIKERSGKKKGFGFESPDFLSILSTGVAMARIFDRTVDWSQKTHVPFVLPADRGVYKGIALQAPQDLSWNRFQVLGANDVEELGLSKFSWFPETYLKVNTYFGPNEMDPELGALAKTLKQFIRSPHGQAIQHELLIYNNVEDQNDVHPNRELYEDAVIELYRIMQSREWKRAVVLPANLRTSYPGRWIS